MEWTLKLEARSSWREVEPIEVGRLKRRVVGPRTVAMVWMVFQHAATI
jgi:hypothetical protein